jgi:hypothetical protein
LLPQLATYLGHVDIRSTQRYLQMTPELLQAASRALSVRRMAACPRRAGLPCRSPRALLLRAVSHHPPGRRGPKHRGYRRGVPSRHPRRKPRSLEHEAPPHHDPRAHAERASPICLLDAGALAGARREDRPGRRRAVRGDHAGEAASRAGLQIVSRHPALGKGLWGPTPRSRMPSRYHHRRNQLPLDRFDPQDRPRQAFLSETPDADPIQHGNIRGRSYYH